MMYKCSSGAECVRGSLNLGVQIALKYVLNTNIDLYKVLNVINMVDMTMHKQPYNMLKNICRNLMKYISNNIC
jgi:hypothetical protein